jgi:glucosamine--fructose-6-phosphate aminotransferase (isomerizing)
MCGIVGYSGTRNAVDLLVRGLKRLEYRGYDSSGIAVFLGGQLQVRKSQGRLTAVEDLLQNEAGLPWSEARCGIGHTRWATHGKPTTQNAHPHRADHVVIVHNGIIENYLELREALQARGHHLQSETDSELYSFLVLEEMNRGASLAQAALKAFRHLEGQCSVVVLSEREPGVIVGIRQGSPMVAAVDPKGGVLIASDAQPLVEYTKEMIFLESGDAVIGGPHGLEIVRLEDGAPVTREVTKIDWSADRLDRGGFDHFMLKEIHEQPNTFTDTLNGLLDREHQDSFPLDARLEARAILEAARSLTLVACGTSWHAALMGKYWLEKWARIPVNVELASEYRYRDPVLGKGEVLLGITQSGETADTLAVLREARRRGARTIGITNVRNSSITREAEATLFTHAGPEVGVAATKTFTAQMLTLLLCAGYLGVRRGERGEESMTSFFQEIVRLPHLMAGLLSGSSHLRSEVQKAAKALQASRGFFFMGRGTSYPLALEGALKLKEIAYVHAEGYAAGELKHGPIAMIDKEMTVIVLAPRDGWRDKTVSNLEEVKARGARILGIGCETDLPLRSLCDFWLPIAGSVSDELAPFLMAPLLQLFSYEIALLKGTDIDKPRNLAKSVTVE